MADELTSTTPEEQKSDVAPVTEDTASIAEASTEPQPEPEKVPTPEEFIQQELASLKASLRTVSVFGTILVLAISIYLLVIAAGFVKNLEPKEAAKMATAEVMSAINDNGEQFVDAVRERAPLAVEQATQVVIEQMPPFRKDIEQKFEEGLNNYCAQTSEQLNGKIDTFLDENKDEIKTLLDATDVDAASLSAALNELVMEYLKAKPADGGPSIKEQVADSLKMLKNAESELTRLAKNKNLNAKDKRARRGVAIIAGSIDSSELEPVTLPQIQPREEAEATTE
jgi:hypothetical protein